MLRTFEKTPQPKILSELDFYPPSGSTTLSTGAFLVEDLPFGAENINKSEKILIQSTGHIYLKWLPEIIKKLEEISNLQKNWDTYQANPISIDVICYCLSFVFKILERCDLPPSIVPTSLGGIQLEWHTDKGDLEIEIGENRKISYYFENVTNGEEIQKSDINFEDQIFEFFSLL